MQHYSPTGSRWRGVAAPLAALVVSGLAGGIILSTSYGLRPLVDGLANANCAALIMAIGVGFAIQVARAWRAALLLSPHRSIRVSDTYHAMVVGHGLGDLVPIAPCSVGLRCFLTERLSSLSIPFSAGVFMLEGVLDGVGPAALTATVLTTLQVPTWIRVLLIMLLCQSLALFAVPFAARWLRRFRRLIPRSGWLARSIAVGGDIANGLSSGLSRGTGHTTLVIACSVGITALAGVQLTLLLATFGLSASPGRSLLILVLTLAAGSVPIKIPGSGTMATAAVLSVAGVHGAGVAGYVLMSRLVLSSEATVLACASLAWWGATGKTHDLRVGSTLQTLMHGRWLAALSRARSMGNRLSTAVSAAPQLPVVRRLRSRTLIAVALFGAVALLGATVDTPWHWEVVTAANLAQAGNAPAGRSAYVRTMPDSVRDTLRAGHPITQRNRHDKDRDRTSS